MTSVRNPVDNIDYKCSCALNTSSAAPAASSPLTMGVSQIAATSKKQPAIDAVAAAIAKVDAAIALVSDGGTVKLFSAITDVKTLTDTVTTINGFVSAAIIAINQANAAESVTSKKISDQLIKDVNEANKVPIIEVKNDTDVTALFTALNTLKAALDPLTNDLSLMSGGKRKHTRRKHCKHGKNIMHCPYCKHGSKHGSKHCNKSKKGKKRSKRTRKVDRIARNLERSLERSLNESHNSKKSKRSRRKSK